ncbi:MAG: sugar ABC transporter substrate-binding protein [Sphaerochaeta sp.]|nr:sugar ABC transporter substrate-binding protein [Sphaerochaeta sp.]
MKKTIGFLLLLTMLLVLNPVFATGTKETELKTSKPGELSGEITFWHSFTQGQRLETIEKAAKDFMVLHPEVKINIQTFSWSDFYKKWTTGLASGNVPDMSSALPPQVVEMIDAEAVLPLDDLIDSIGRDRFYQNALSEMSKDGNTYAIPLYATTEAMWYRKDLLAKYGLEIPRTWDELYDASVIITKGENGSVYGHSVPMGMNDMMATRWLHLYVRSAGETLLTKDKKANLTSPAAIDGIRYWVKMYKDASPKDSINFNVLDQATLYYQGKLAFDFNTGFHISGVKTNTPSLLPYIDCAPMPRINLSDPVVGYETNNTPLVVWKASKNPEICKAFIEYFYDPDRYVDFLLSVPVGMMSVLKDVADNERLLSHPLVQEFSNSQAVMKEMVGGSGAIGMEYGPSLEAGLLTTQRVIENMFQTIIIKDVDVRIAAEEAEKKLNKMFESVK